MKKTIAKIGVLLVALVVSFSATACFGKDGKSAYEIACANGFKGTEEQWLQSLKGKSGLDGQDAAPLDIYGLFDAYLQIHPGTTFEEFLHSFLIVDYYDTEYAASQALCSAVKIRTGFQIQASGVQSTVITRYFEGAGVIYRFLDDEAYIITNYHVVYNYNSIAANKIANEILVFSYGSSDSLSARFIGGSITKDIAIISVPVSDLPSFMKEATVVDSNDISLGERTIAVGNPLAEGISITSGIISVDSENIKMEALDAPNTTTTMRVIRTDAAINSGNSGGGLFNIRGEMIGIINAKTISEGVESMGYAIPSNVATGIADCVIENDSKKCVLGINATVLSQSVRYNTAKNKIEIIESITVHQVFPDTLAENVLMAGDILVSATIADGEPLILTRLFYLSDYLFAARVGDVLRLCINRDETDMTLEITITSAALNAL